MAVTFQQGRNFLPCQIDSFHYLFFIGVTCLLHFLCNPATEIEQIATQKKNMNGFSVTGNSFSVCGNRDNVGRNAFYSGRNKMKVNMYFPAGNSNSSSGNGNNSRRNTPGETPIIPVEITVFPGEMILARHGSRSNQSNFAPVPSRSGVDSGGVTPILRAT